MVDLHVCTAVISQHIGVAQAPKFILPQFKSRVFQFIFIAHLIAQASKDVRMTIRELGAETQRRKFLFRNVNRHNNEPSLD